MTVSGHIRGFLQERTGHTKISYQDSFKGFEAQFGGREPSTVLPVEIKGYLQALQVGASTRHLRYTHLKALFNSALQGIREAGIKPDWENPCLMLNGAFSKPKTEGKPLPATIHEDMATVRAALNEQYKLVYDIGTRAGLRIEEILRITPDTLIRQADEACCIRVAVKGGSVQNKVIPADLCQTLQDWIEKHGIGDDERLFKMSRASVWAVFKARGIEPHDTRRYAAFRALEMGKDLKTIQQMLGHASPMTTIIYLKNLSVSLLAKKLEGM